MKRSLQKQPALYWICYRSMFIYWINTMRQHWPVNLVSREPAFLLGTFSLSSKYVSHSSSSLVPHFRFSFVLRKGTEPFRRKWISCHKSARPATWRILLTQPLRGTSKFSYTNRVRSRRPTGTEML